MFVPAYVKNCTKLNRFNITLKPATPGKIFFCPALAGRSYYFVFLYVNCLYRRDYCRAVRPAGRKQHERRFHLNRKMKQPGKYRRNYLKQLLPAGIVVCFFSCWISARGHSLPAEPLSVIVSGFRDPSSGCSPAKPWDGIKSGLIVPPPESASRTSLKNSASSPLSAPNYKKTRPRGITVQPPTVKCHGTTRLIQVTPPDISAFIETYFIPFPSFFPRSSFRIRPPPILSFGNNRLLF